MDELNQQKTSELLCWRKPEIQNLTINFDTASTKTFSSVDFAEQE